jgi:hypothetical protein
MGGHPVGPPPSSWAVESEGWDYGFLFMPPKKGTIRYPTGGYGLFPFESSPHIDAGLLLVQWGIVVAATVLVISFLKDSPKTKEKSG